MNIQVFGMKKCNDQRRLQGQGCVGTGEIYRRRRAGRKAPCEPSGDEDAGCTERKAGDSGICTGSMEGLGIVRSVKRFDKNRNKEKEFTMSELLLTILVNSRKAYSSYGFMH